MTTSTTIRAACPHDCPDTCAMLVTVEDGVATGVRGDPDHPFTRGGLCVKVNNYQDRVYSDDRVLHPLRRVGAKGSGEFERISWDEALDEIASRFGNIREEFGAESIMPVSYLGAQGVLNGLNVGDAFFNAIGATVAERTYCDSGASTACTLTIGTTAGLDPESFAHSKYIIIWACNMVSTNLHMWPFVLEAQRNGAKVVVIDPVRHRTAQRADWHIPIRPGTDGALALAMMHVIITEGLTDEDYVADHTLGYDELAERVQQYTPEWAEGESGVPAEDIRTLAREYAANQPSAIRIGVAIERHAGSGQAVRAITCLPALVGAWRRAGGGLLQMTSGAFPLNWMAAMRPDLLTPGTRVVNQYLLGRALSGELKLDPPLKALVVYNSNPVTVCPEQDKVLAGLARDDLFTVVSEHFITDTAAYADIVLPATTQLEQLDIMFSWGQLYVTLNEPAIEPRGEAVPNTELFRRLAARMGLEDPGFRRTDEEMVRDSFDWSSPAMAGITYESLKTTGWARLNVGPPEEFAPYAEGGFPTRSGRCEFKSSAAVHGNVVGLAFRQGSSEFQPGQPVDPLPHYIPPREVATDDSAYPLTLLSPKSHAYLNSSYGNLPAQQRVQKTPAVTIHPADAGARGISDGQQVRVFNDRGEFAVEARLSDEVATGVVVSPMGAWREAGSTVNAVTPFTFADLGNAPTFSDNLVEVRPAD